MYVYGIFYKNHSFLHRTKILHYVYIGSMSSESSLLKQKKATCVYCGNNPTSHMNAWIDSTLFVLSNESTQKMIRSRVGKILVNIIDYMVERFCDLLVYGGVLTIDEGSDCITLDRAKVLHEATIARGGRMYSLLFFGKSIDTYRIVFANGKKIFFNGLPRPDAVASATIGWIDDKAALKQCIEAVGVPVSRGGSVQSYSGAKKYFTQINAPVIVKPRLGSRGRHTTTHIATLPDLKKGFRIAKQLCHYVVVEQHLEGSVYRATMVDGVLVGVLAGDPPRVTGDGVHTIRELIALKNEHRPPRVREVVCTDTLVTFLARIHHTLEEILPKGVTIDLSEKIGLAYGGNAREVTPQVHPKLRIQLERAAHAVGDILLGFDFITTDVTVDPDTLTWGIIECNAVPFIDLHHFPNEGEPVNVAEKLLDCVEGLL